VHPVVQWYSLWKSRQSSQALLVRSVRLLSEPYRGSYARPDSLKIRGIFIKLEIKKISTSKHQNGMWTMGWEGLKLY
jgi:hypothetical protein